MSEKKLISVKGAAAPTAPLSPALTYENLVFVSGQIARDLVSGASLFGGIREETEQVLKNVRQLLEAAGSSMDCVLKTTVFITEKSYFEDMNKVYEKEFSASVKPARSTIVTTLAGDAKVEIEAIAYIPKK